IIGLIDRALQGLALADELAAHVDIGRHGPHGETGHKAPLHQRVGIMAQYVAILAGSGLRFVGIDDEIARAPVTLLGHEGPLQAGRETRPAAAAQAGGLHLVDDPVAPLVDQALGIVPDAARHGALQRLVEAAVNVGEDAVLVLKHLSSQTRLESESSTFCSPWPVVLTSASRSPPCGASAMIHCTRGLTYQSPAGTP